MWHTLFKIKLHGITYLLVSIGDVISNARCDDNVKWENSIINLSALFGFKDFAGKGIDGVFLYAWMVKSVSVEEKCHPGIYRERGHLVEWWDEEIRGLWQKHLPLHWVGRGHLFPTSNLINHCVFCISRFPWLQIF